MPLARGHHPGPCEILAPIGKGGMGEVFRARDSHLHRDAAVKTPRSASPNASNFTLSIGLLQNAGLVRGS
jgi:serine/threonine protein kinase